MVLEVPNILLAKRSSDQALPAREETLVGHTVRVFEAAKVLSDLLANNIKEMVQCSDDYLQHWKMAVRLGAWFHDWGKANNHFQQMIRIPSFTQGIRHEALSMVMCNELEDWLSPLWNNLPMWAKAGAYFSAGGHHLKYPDPFEGKRPGLRVRVFYSHENFKELLGLGVDWFSLKEVPELKDLDYDLLPRGNLKKCLNRLPRQFDNDYSSIEKSLIATIKATVLAADLAGSALPKKTARPEQWIEKKLEEVLQKKQVNRVVRQKLGGQQLLEFQRRISGIQSNTVLLEAGCGSGKTVAAYLWASRNANGKRLFFSYPTTGTASEGFSGYLQDPDFDSMLIHGRAEVDYRLLPNMPLRGHEENDLRNAGLEALETWPIPAVVCTTHTVLGLLENVRRGLFAWPSLARSVFVFDEIHAFSEKLFSYFLRFLEAFPGARVLLMTATLPPSRRKAIEAVSKKRGGIVIVRGPERREKSERYLLEKLPAEQAWPEVEGALQKGGRVLWVCNTVARAMETVNTAIEKGLTAEPFHSRYRYRDRLRRQRAVIDGFKGEGSPMLAVATQVAEISLDISADMLVSEYAPIPAMIQRMGRLNRFDEEPRRPGTALFIDPGSPAPYDGDEKIWNGVRRWLDSLCDGQSKSQWDITEAFAEITERDEGEIKPVQYCEWLDGIWSSRKDERAIEEAGYTIEVVREEDLDTGSTTENAIPMPFPKTKDYQTWNQVGRYLVAPRRTIIYDEFKGAKWNTA